jgi:LysM repeat protein
MQNARQVIWGIVTALVSIALTIGALSLSLTEGNLHAPTSTLLFTATLLSTTTPTRQPFTLPAITTTPLTPTQIITQTLTQSPTQTPTLPPPPTICPPPQGWRPYTVKPGDTLDGLALLYKRTSAEISQANCLATNGLLPGQIIYLPPVPTRTPIPCGPPSNWVIYIVQTGDTLYRLSQAYGVTVTELQKANCITGSLIHLGQSLYVPPWGPLFPSPTYSPIITFVDENTATETPTATETATP